MEEKRQYLEKRHHGTSLFPADYYHCVYPAGLAGLPVHWHEEFEITRVRRGSCTYLIDLEPCQVGEGDFLFLPSGMLHGIPEGKTRLLETDSFVFHPSLLGGRADACGVKYLAPVEKGEIRFPPVMRAKGSSPEFSERMERLFDRLKESFAKREEGYELEVKAGLLEILLLLYRQIPFERKKQENREVIEKLRTVLQYIKENYQRPLSVAELAGVCHFSEYYFMRFFKQHMNMTCVEYVNQYRMEIAAGRLAGEEASITDIALDTGFNNLSYFNRVFRRSFGMTPKAYRQALSQKSASGQEEYSATRR